jgi:hypothetical protein
VFPAADTEKAARNDLMVEESIGMIPLPMKNMCFRLIALPLLLSVLATSRTWAQDKPFEPVSGSLARTWSGCRRPRTGRENARYGEGDAAGHRHRPRLGDGRNVIAAAKRGARAFGFEFNPDMVALSRRRAKEAGVSDRATFIEGDMFEADISKATVLALFLLPSNLDKLAPKF